MPHLALVPHIQPATTPHQLQPTCVFTGAVPGSVHGFPFMDELPRPRATERAGRRLYTCDTTMLVKRQGEFDYTRTWCVVL